MSKIVIPTLDPSISYEHFCNEFMYKNIPCLFTSQLTQHWKCRSEWVCGNGNPNLQFLNDNFGDSIVPVVNCGEKYYNSNPKEDMKFSDYIVYWTKTRDVKHNYTENDMKIYYLKDWHFMSEYPKYNAYQIPVYLESDWLNEYCLKCQYDDYRFVYMGPKDSFTPLHTDVFGSFSWSVNICGKKRWALIPPENIHILKDANNGIIPHDIYSIGNYDNIKNKLGMIEIEQNVGEMIFVPSEWMHQVMNVEDTISINHNWFNAYNIEHIWNRMNGALSEIQHELSDIKDLMNANEWHCECQNILKIHHGMNYKDFIENLKIISERLIEETNNNKYRYLFRVLFDLKVMIKIFNKLIDCNLIVYDIREILNKLNDALNKLENC